MKNDYEMYQSLLSRYNDYQEKKKKRIRTIRRTVPVLACFCFTVLFGLRFWDDLAKLSRFPRQPDIVDEPMIESSESTTVADTTESSSMDQAIITDAVSTTISAQNSKTDMVVTTGSPQTVTTAVSGEESGRETENETIEHTETQVHATTAPAIETTLNIQPQTTTPVQTTEKTPVTTINPNIHEVRFGYPEGGDIGHYAPSSSKIIAMKCMSFCAFGETLKVDAAMGDGSLSPINYDTAGDYKYEVYACNTVNYKDTEDDRFIANGERKGYKKEYSRDEIELFDINGEYDNFELYHHETTELDFSSYTSGDSGCILFAFTAVYTEDPLYPSYMGSKKFMYFYVGEKGTAISDLSVENAIENYNDVTMS